MLGFGGMYESAMGGMFFVIPDAALRRAEVLPRPSR